MEEQIAIYEWRAWKWYLISYIFPDATIIHGNMQERASSILDQLHGHEKLFLFQVNLTNTTLLPLERSNLITELNRRGVTILNQNLTDISKRWLQGTLASLGLPTTLATKSGPPSEMLVIKTNENYGGESELSLSGDQRASLSVPTPASVPGGRTPYQVAQRCEIPASVFDSPNLCVERYIFSKDSSFYRVYKARDIILLVKAHSESLIKKVNGDTRDINIVTTKGELLGDWPDIPKRLGVVLHWFFMGVDLDYGSLDVVTDGAEYYIIDVNVTPWGGLTSPDLNIVKLIRNALLEKEPGLFSTSKLP